MVGPGDGFDAVEKRKISCPEFGSSTAFPYLSVARTAVQ
jgi:hypothetical protein